MPNTYEVRAIKSVIRNEPEQLRSLLDEHQVDVNTKSKKGNSLLFLSVKNKHPQITKLLLERGAQLKVQNNAGETPMSRALTQFDDEICTLLVNASIERELAPRYYQQLSSVRAAQIERHIVESYDTHIQFMMLRIECLQSYLKEDLLLPAEIIMAYQEKQQLLLSELNQKDYSISSSRRLLAHASDLSLENPGSEIQTGYEERIKNIAKQYNMPTNPEFWRKETVEEKLEQLDCVLKAFQSELNKLLIDFDERQSDQIQIMHDHLKQHDDLLAEINGMIKSACPDKAKMLTLMQENKRPNPIPEYPRHINIDAIKCLLQAGFPAGMADIAGNTLLHRTVDACDMDSVILLTDWQWHAPIEQPNEEGQTPLQWATSDPAINILLAYRNKEYLAMQAVHQDRYELLKTQLKQGITADTKDHRGNTLLHWAARLGHTSLVRLLVKKGAHRTLRNHLNQTPLEFAGEPVSPEIHNLLDIHPDREKAFQVVKEDNLNKLNTLIANGLPIETQDDDGCTLLYRAVELKLSGIIRFLASKGALYSTKNAHGESPLELARRSNVPLYQQLMTAGNNERILRATKSGDQEIVDDCLKKYFALLYTADSEAQSLVHLCVASGHLALMKHLLAQGAPYLKENKNGVTPVHSAANLNRPEFLKALNQQWLEDVESAVIKYQSSSRNEKQIARVQLLRLFAAQASLARKNDLSPNEFIEFKTLALEKSNLEKQTLLGLFHLWRQKNQLESLSLAFQPEVSNEDVLNALIDWQNQPECHIRTLDLSHTGLTDEHFPFLQRLIIKGTINTLCLDGNFLTDHSAKELINLIAAPDNKVTFLSLNGNNHISWSVYAELQSVLIKKSEAIRSIPKSPKNDESPELLAFKTQPLPIEYLYREWCTLAGRLQQRMPIKISNPEQIDRIKAKDFLLRRLLGEAKSLVNETAGMVSSIPAVLTKLCVFFEELMQQKWVKKHKLYENTTVVAFYNTLRQKQNEVIEQYKANNYFDEITLPVHIRPTTVLRAFEDTFIMWMKAVKGIMNQLNPNDDFDLATAERYKFKFIDQLVSAPWAQNQRKALHNLTNGKRLSLEYPKTQLNDHLTKSEFVELQETGFTKPVRKKLAAMLDGEDRLKFYLKGLGRAMDDSFRRDRLQIDPVVISFLTKFMQYYKEPLLLLTESSARKFAEAVVYHFSDFIALCGEKALTESNFVDLALNWIFHGVSRAPVELETRLGETVSSYTVLQQCGLIFRDHNGQELKLNVIPPDKKPTSAEHWGCRIATTREGDLYKTLCAPGSINVRIPAFSHTPEENLTPDMCDLNSTALLTEESEDFMVDIGLY